LLYPTYTGYLFLRYILLYFACLVAEEGQSSKSSIVSKKSSAQMGEYDLEDHISKPTTTNDIPEDLLTLQYPFLIDFDVSKLRFENK